VETSQKNQTEGCAVERRVEERERASNTSAQANMAGLVATMNHFQYLEPKVFQMNIIANFRHIACARTVASNINICMS